MVRIPRVRVLIIVCDPLTRLDKHILYCAQFPETFHTCTRSPDRLTEDNVSVRSALGNNRLMQELSMGRALKDMQYTFEDRLKLYHQESLRESPQVVFAEIAKFIGVQPFPAGRTFRRFNSRCQNKTDLCSNPAWVKELKQQLAGEYEALEDVLTAAGQPIPAVLQQRRGICERVDDDIHSAGCVDWPALHVARTRGIRQQDR
eukprot:gnl/TRDRNA2_/TRDRNA2_171547_c0_seq3.p1 gnl/TRDRNA2_/TRDRNA2_171547_c0~~gnl/TRDRNA2_/TRDRNA2_171547_c0_seq3.p1  ORF type:complete len:203 (-),score=12.29 gnl/TRDRNA2_/TRDRNA2_171547_c0_seq3:22-630(-)